MLSENSSLTSWNTGLGPCKLRWGPGYVCSAYKDWRIWGGRGRVVTEDIRTSELSAHPIGLILREDSVSGWNQNKCKLQKCEQ